MQTITWLTPNETETRALLGKNDTVDFEPAAAAREVLSRGVSNVILKLGEKGAFVLGKGGTRVTVPAFPVTAIDTTAAGDAFNGAFAVALMRGNSINESTRYACAVAAISVTRRGAQPSMPSQTEVAKFMKAHAPGN